MSCFVNKKWNYTIPFSLKKAQKVSNISNMKKIEYNKTEKENAGRLLKELTKLGELSL